MKKMSVCIIIVNYRTPHLTLDCLASLAIEREQLLRFTVIVVDNNSGDESVPFLLDEIERREWNQWISLLPLSLNGGFSYGNNAAIRKLLGSETPSDYIWLLNPDTIIYKGACIELVNFLERHPKVGIVGSQLEDLDGTLQVSAFRDHSIISEFLYGIRMDITSKLFNRWKVAKTPISNSPSKTDWVSGASLMMRKELLDQVGLLDESYFMYYEEVDFCIRSRDVGWECWCVPLSRVVHLIGASSGIVDSRKKSSRRPDYWFESRHRFFLKNYGKIYLLCADTLLMLGYLLWRLRRIILKKPDNDPPYFFKDFFSNSIYCKGGRL